MALVRTAHRFGSWLEVLGVSNSGIVFGVFGSMCVCLFRSGQCGIRCLEVNDSRVQTHSNSLGIYLGVSWCRAILWTALEQHARSLELSPTLRTHLSALLCYNSSCLGFASHQSRQSPTCLKDLGFMFPRWRLGQPLWKRWLFGALWFHRTMFIPQVLKLPWSWRGRKKGAQVQNFKDQLRHSHLWVAEVLT